MSAANLRIAERLRDAMAPARRDEARTVSAANLQIAEPLREAMARARRDEAGP